MKAFQGSHGSPGHSTGSHSQQNSIPKLTDFHENIFNLIQIRNPVSLPSYFQTKAPLSTNVENGQDDFSR